MSRFRALPLFYVVCLGALTACSPAGGGASKAQAGLSGNAAASDSSAVVAEVNGQKITWAELDEQAAPRLARLRQQEYEIRRDTLETMIADRLVEAEARERGISTDQLLEREVEASKPSTTDLARIYERNRTRFAGQTREEAYAHIEELLRQRGLAERRAALHRRLRKKANVTVHLEAPRVAVELPEDTHGTGPENAPVTIVEFTDYQCPFCHRAQGVIDRILEEYAGKVRLVHLDYPLQNHPGAVPAARAARCAAEQGDFWKYHRDLMTEKGSLDETDLLGRATRLELDEGEFTQCLASGRYDDDIQAQVQQGSRLGVTGTPAYFINGRMISGAQPFDAFAQVIDDELAAS
jgi:protein-disulfide isomerase